MEKFAHVKSQKRLQSVERRQPFITLVFFSTLTPSTTVIECVKASGAFPDLHH